MRIKFILIAVVLLIFPLAWASAQPGDPGNGPPGVPLGGLEYLLGAGALYGIKKIYDARKKKTD